MQTQQIELFPFPLEALKWSDHEIGAFLLDHFIAVKAAALGFPPDQIPEDLSEHIVSLVLKTESKTAQNAALEKALHKAAKGAFEEAGKIFREYFIDVVFYKAALDEVATGRRKQRKIAQKSRTDALQDLIIKILEKNPKIKEKEMLDNLRKEKGCGVIESIEDGNIEWTDKNGKIKDTPLSAIKNRMYRARKKVSSR